MTLTKEDYMRLPKERLAELLVELDGKILQITPSIPPESPSIPIMPTKPSGWGCDGTICTNPQMDCINCPRTLHYGITICRSKANDTTIYKEEQK